MAPFTVARTLTCSPGVKAPLTMKLAPLPAEYGCTEPECDPLRDPTTCTPVIVRAPVPRKLIWVVGDASGARGSGETVTGCAAAAARSRCDSDDGAPPSPWATAPQPAASSARAASG